MNTKNKWLLFVVIILILIVGIVFTIKNFATGKNTDSQPMNSDVSSSADLSTSINTDKTPEPSLVESPAYSEQANTSEAQNMSDDILDVVSNFLEAYYAINADQDTGYSLSKHFETYSDYLTGYCKDKLRPETQGNNDMDAGDHTQIFQELTRSKLYYADITDSSAAVMALALVASSFDTIAPTQTTYLLTLELRKENDGWKINDILVNEQVRFNLPASEIFN